ncbi:arylsulfatase [Haloferula sp. A504]|uniref:arylsulfatase n=1 Tax=Haloferula sp. A504 TaxID=3373601 RepID=UPI0031C29F95|nr:arylsulfatase [Verrucomicrobiaceae bacterium E54]
MPRHLLALLHLALCHLSLGAAPRPNIVVIMVDDMGYSDLGCFGAEIETPHLDSLAGSGLRFTHFYNAGRCCPTRASLLTGLYQHQAGIGMMSQDLGHPAYQGFLNDHCVTLAEALRPAGYFTAISGKWHVGSAPEHWPLQRGFHRFYGTPQGGGHHYRNLPGRELVMNDEVIPVPDDWYSTTAFTDHALQFLDEGFEAGKPVLLYLAYTAPHWALHAPDEEIAKFRGRYRQGWQPVREARFARQMKMGLFPAGTKLSPPDPRMPDWEKVKDPEEMDLRMATHAAMVHLIDRGVGRVVEKLRQYDQLDNTLILFFSDNGASAESGPTGFTGSRGGDPKARTGTSDSYNSFGIAGANLCDTPFRRYKMEMHEGGIATPLIAHWPKGIPEELEGSITTTPGHIIDLMPTCLDLAEASYPSRQDLTPLEGLSLKPALQGKAMPRREFYFEHMGNAAVRIGPWKLVRAKGKPWELYTLTTDRTELKDLAKTDPEMANAMATKWKIWAARVGVQPYPLRDK